MQTLYEKAIRNGKKVYHRQYCLYKYREQQDYRNVFYCAFDNGSIRLVSVDYCDVTVWFQDGTVAQWNAKWLTSYIKQFGVTVTLDGKYIFVQTWENGLFCLDSRTGEKLWRTKSKRGITSLFLNEKTLLIHQRNHALQLVDIHSGEVIREKRPATAWGFTAIDHNHIICQVTARRWEVIHGETMDVVQTFSHREFTNGHENYASRPICVEDNHLIIRGFRNVWDDSVSPPKMLPNLTYEHRLKLNIHSD